MNQVKEVHVGIHIMCHFHDHLNRVEGLLFRLWVAENVKLDIIIIMMYLQYISEQ